MTLARILLALTNALHGSFYIKKPSFTRSDDRSLESHCPRVVVVHRVLWSFLQEEAD